MALPLQLNIEIKLYQCLRVNLIFSFFNNNLVIDSFRFVGQSRHQTNTCARKFCETASDGCGVSKQPAVTAVAVRIPYSLPNTCIQVATN